jgi:hypothetical protein
VCRILRLLEKLGRQLRQFNGYGMGAASVNANPAVPARQCAHAGSFANLKFFNALCPVSDPPQDTIPNSNSQ